MSSLAPIAVAYVLVVSGALGLVMGSFVNCWAWRYVNGESIVAGRSHCVACGHELGLRDLVPVFSWLSTKGRCRYCGQAVSVRYPLTELVSCALFVALAVVYGVSLETAELMAFFAILLFVSLVDLDIYIIPNGAVVAAVAVRALYLVGTGALAYAGLPARLDVVPAGDAAALSQHGTLGIDARLAPDVGALAIDSLIGAAALLVALTVIVLAANRVFGRSSMGGGDLKLFAVAGLYFGWQEGVFLVIVACIIGIAMGLVAPKGTLDAHYDDDSQEESVGDSESPGKLKRSISFGPSIAVACVIVAFAGAPFVSWYVGLLA